jgi:large subunit ribosomal protein L25
MANDITVAAEPRTLRGKNEARRLRAAGSTPAVVYGVGQETFAVAVNPKEVSKILRSKTGHNTIFTLAIKGGENTPVMIVDWQKDPIKDNLLHVDLKRIDLTVRLVVKVPVHTVGEPEGVKIQGGLHEIVTREIEVECLPNEIPDDLTVDVSALTIGQSVRAGDVALPGSVKLVSPADAVISHVVTMRAEEVAAPVAGVEGAPAAAAEPEVIKKGKKEEDEEAAADDKKKK